MEAFFKKMLDEKYEGIMIKSLQGEYQAGTRGWNWIKWKKDYVRDMIDTFDLVVVGAFYGKGRRSGTYGALLCAAYDNKKDEFPTVCKLGTGLTDEMLASLPKRLKIVKNKPARQFPLRHQIRRRVAFPRHQSPESLHMAPAATGPHHRCPH